MKTTFSEILHTAGMLLVAVGVLLIVTGLLLGLSAAHFTWHARPAQATVLELQPRPGLRRRTETVYAPLYQFQAGAQWVRFSGAASSLPARVGEQVEILYDPQQPQQARVNDLSLWRWPLGALTAGALILATALVLADLAEKMRPAPVSPAPPGLWKSAL